MNTADDDFRLRIALVPPLWARLAPGTSGGAEEVVRTLADELVKRGHDVTVFAARDSVTCAKVAPLSDRNLLHEIEQGRNLEYDYYEACNIAEVLGQGAEFDVLHFHVGGYAIPLGTLSGCPVLHTLHNPVTPDAAWILERYPAAAVTAVSRHQISRLPESRRRSIHVVPNACDFNSYRFSPARGRYLAFLGRMTPAKGPADALRIARLAGMPLVLAGQAFRMEDQSYFDEQIRPHIDGKKVIYLGPVDHAAKNDLLQNAAALLFPIQWAEPFGLVMIEAMACGTPVVGLRRGSVEEVVDAGVTGYYADTADELARLVPKALALDRGRVRRHAQHRFGQERMVDDYLVAYRMLLQSLHHRAAERTTPPLAERTCAS